MLKWGRSRGISPTEALPRAWGSAPELEHSQRGRQQIRQKIALFQKTAEHNGNSVREQKYCRNLLLHHDSHRHRGRKRRRRRRKEAGKRVSVFMVVVQRYLKVEGSHRTRLRAIDSQSLSLSLRKRGGASTVVLCTVARRVKGKGGRKRKKVEGERECRVDSERRGGDRERGGGINRFFFGI